MSANTAFSRWTPEKRLAMIALIATQPANEDNMQRIYFLAEASDRFLENNRANYEREILETSE